jgi:hypothetical protein
MHHWSAFKPLHLRFFLHGYIIQFAEITYSVTIHNVRNGKQQTRITIELTLHIPTCGPSQREKIKVKKKAKMSLYIKWKHIAGLEAQIHSFLTLVLDGDKWSASFPGQFTSGQRSTQYPANTRLDGVHSVWTLLRRDKSLAPYGIWTLDQLVCCLVTILTTLRHLLQRMWKYKCKTYLTHKLQ